MAEIWFCSEAGQPFQEDQLDERPFAECVTLLDLSADRYLGMDPTKRPEATTGMTAGDKYLVGGGRRGRGGAHGLEARLLSLAARTGPSSRTAWR